MDVTDWYQEAVVADPASPSGLSSIYKGAHEPIIPIPETFRMNVPGTGALDNIVTVDPSASVPPVVLVVPRHGPLVSFTAPSATSPVGSAISVQYVGFYPTHELEAFMM